VKSGPVRLVADAVTIARLHIVLIAMAATLVFGWLMTGRYLVGLALVSGVDWFVINLVNRITDIDEDLRNGIPGTERVAKDKRAFAAVAMIALALSFAATAVLWPALLPARLAVQAIGLGYNYRVVPTPRGWSRFKEMYFFKNFMSAVLFVLTGFVYPLLVAPRTLPWPAIATLAAFFVAFELSYEILYDFRDLPGDREHSIPTYPVVHGELQARRIMNGLLLLSAAILMAGLSLRWIGLRDALMLAAPVLQWALARAWLKRGLTRRDCILLTNLGTVLLLCFLAGTAVWLRLGLPANVWL
jgi:4-hydroxybenzoate polyprenyltransferase